MPRGHIGRLGVDHALGHRSAVLLRRVLRQTRGLGGGASGLGRRRRGRWSGSGAWVVITSNIFAIIELRSLYFVLAGAMEKFKYLKIALAVLLVLIGVKLILHDLAEVSHTITLAVIAGVIGAGVIALVISSRRAEAVGAVEPAEPG
jgi:hypothetical protein